VILEVNFYTKNYFLITNFISGSKLPEDKNTDNIVFQSDKPRNNSRKREGYNVNILLYHQMAAAVAAAAHHLARI